MKRRWLSLLLALALTIPPAWAAEGAKPIEPTAPEWIRAEDYLTFPGDEVYRPENWARLQTLREDAGAGGSFPQSQRNEPEGSPGTCYELGLIRLETWRDSRPVQLYFVDGEQIGAFSHITVNREVRA